MRAQIIGTGSCLPAKIVTNDFLSTMWRQAMSGSAAEPVSVSVILQ